MKIEQYLMIPTETNIVENTCMWDGDVNTWQPPINTLMLIQADIPAMIWEAVIIDKKITDYVLAEKLGQAQIGYIWDGSACITNEPKPAIPSV